MIMLTTANVVRCLLSSSCLLSFHSSPSEEGVCDGTETDADRSFPAFHRALRDIYAAVSKGPVADGQEEVQSDQRAMLHLLDEDGVPGEDRDLA